MATAQSESLRDFPDDRGFFNEFGGRFVPETLMPLIQSLKMAYDLAKNDAAFQAQLDEDHKVFTGRPSPLYPALRLSEYLGGAQIFFKREELNHTGAHKINNCLGQVQLAKRMGKPRIIAETGAGQHGVAAATVCARENLECIVFMGVKDIARQKSNVKRMRMLGAEVRPVSVGGGGLSDALSEALRYWVAHVDDTYYMIGTAAGPDPYPRMVRDFQSVIGNEVRWQSMEALGRLPDTLVAAIGGGSNAIGLFHPFLDDKDVQMIGVEAGGHGTDTDRHAASITAGSPGVLHGNRTYLLQDEHGQIRDADSISAGLDYPGVGPEHSWLHSIGRAKYVAATDKEALNALQLCTRLEGIMPSLEPSHALAHVMNIAPELPSNHVICVNVCGRGDKDIDTVTEHLGIEI